MYVTDGKRIRKVKVWRDNMSYKYAAVRIGLFRTVITWSCYSDPVTRLLIKLQPLGWKQIDVKSPFKRFLNFLKSRKHKTCSRNFIF